MCFAGWNLIITGKPLAHKRNVQAVDLPWLLHDADYDRSIRLLPPKCQTGRSDERRVYSYDFKPAINYWFWKSIWNVIWNSCCIWFLPCEYQNESTVSLCEYIPSVKIFCTCYFISLFTNFICGGNLAIFCCRVKTRAKSGIDGNFCGAAIQMALKRFHWSRRVDGKVQNMDTGSMDPLFLLPLKLLK